MLNGIPNFHGKIEIQSQMFRTDPRFETYNSSGYVYQNSSRSLFIKSRHKSKMELIRLFYDEPRTFETTADLSKVPPLPKPPAPEPKKQSQKRKIQFPQKKIHRNFQILKAARQI